MQTIPNIASRHRLSGANAGRLGRVASGNHLTAQNDEPEPVIWCAIGTDVVADPAAHTLTRLAECSSPGVAQLAAGAPRMLALLQEAATGAFDSSPIAHANWLARVEQITSELAGCLS